VITPAAGLRNVHWKVFQPVHVSSPYKGISEVMMERTRPASLRHGLATGHEIDEILTGMHAFAQKPSTLVALPRIVRVWGTARDSLTVLTAARRYYTSTPPQKGSLS
jgi:hypothetical protein